MYYRNSSTNRFVSDRQDLWQCGKREICNNREKILKKCGSRYYKPDNNDFFYLAIDADTFLFVGDEFVETDIPMIDCSEIILTKKELKTSKISLKRIREIEDLLNSK